MVYFGQCYKTYTVINSYLKNIPFNNFQLNTMILNSHKSYVPIIFNRKLLLTQYIIIYIYI